MNRRQNLRKSRRLQVRFWTDADPRQRAGFTTNISATGMFIGTRNPLAVGAELTVRTLTQPAFEVSARVARSVKVPPALQMVKQPGMGLHFLGKGVGSRLAEDVAASSPIVDDGVSSQEETPEPARTGEGPTAEAPPVPSTETAPPPLASDDPVKEEASPSSELHDPKRTDLSTANVPARAETQDSSSSGSTHAKLLQERRMLQDRVSQLEEKVGSLYSDNQSLRRYSDLLENTRKRLTADVATVRTELKAEKKSSEETQALAEETLTLEQIEAETQVEKQVALDTALAEIETLRGDLEQLRSREKSLTGDVSRLETESASQKSEIKKDKAELARQKSHLEAQSKASLKPETKLPKPKAKAVADPEFETLREETARLRAKNADLSSQLQTALEFDAEPATAVAERRYGGPAVWAALAGVALLGFILGFLFRPTDRSGLVTEGTADHLAASTATVEADPTPKIEETGADAETPESLDLPPQPVIPDLDRVAGAIDLWASAWAAQDVESYLATYSVDFVPALGYDWDSWAANRRERVLAPASIQLGVSELDVQDTGLGRATARFVQSYSTPTYEDRVRKTLELGWEEEEWRILGEFSEPIE